MAAKDDSASSVSAAAAERAREARSPKLASESIPLLCTLFLGDLGVLERTKEVFQGLVAMWKNFVDLKTPVEVVAGVTAGLRATSARESSFVRGPVSAACAAAVLRRSLRLVILFL